VPSSVVFQQPTGRVDLRNPYNWWNYVAGADWRHPRGPQSSIAELDEHPMVHVAFQDAEAYARRPRRALSASRMCPFHGLTTSAATAVGASARAPLLLITSR
jgi:hypothetical protein